MTVDPERGGPEDAQVDDLRQRLRALGYLDAGVDRFVLAPAQADRSTAVIATLASARIGLLGACLLAPAAALGIAARLPGLVTSARDAVVIALYMALLFGLGITAAALCVSGMVSLAARRAGGTLSRRARGFSVGAGVLVGLASLAYLTLLWTTSATAAAAAPVAWSMAGLGVAVAFSLLLGHAVTVSTLALIVARTGTPIRTRGVPGASWPVMLTAGALAFGGALLVFNYRSTIPNGSAAPQLTVVPSGLRVRVVAIDGFDPAVFDKLAAAGRLPSLTAAFNTAGARLAFDDGGDPASAAIRPDPARTWTTIATGQPASRHGVETLETRRVAGVQGTLAGAEGTTAGQAVRAVTDLLRLTRPAIASGSERREKTFWEVAAEAGLRTAVVNWWATWPASGDDAVVLTDRATLRLERGGALDGEIAPAALYDTLRGEYDALRSRAEAAATRALDRSHVEGETAALLRRSASLDAITLQLTAAVSNSGTDLVVTYLPGLDIAQHTLLDTGDSGRSPSTVASRLASLEDYYEALDQLLAPVLSARGQEVVMLVTAPGRVTAGARGRLTLTGPAARPGARLDANATDVAPTVLYALGVPLSEQFAGRPAASLFSEDFLARYAIRHVPSYGRPQTARAVRSGQPLDQEMIDRLRSLGYVR